MNEGPGATRSAGGQPSATAAPYRPAWWPQLDWTYEALLFLSIGAETCVLYLATEALFSTGLSIDTTVSPLILFALLWLGTVIQRALEAHRLFSPEYEVVTVVALTLTLLVAVRLIAFPHYALADFGWLPDAARAFALFPTSAARPVWGAALLVAYTWWRGRSRAQPDLEAAYRMLRNGTVANVVLLLIAIALVPAAGNAPVWRALYAAIVLFFLCALTATALARLRIEQARGTLTLTPRWFGAFVWPIVALLAAGTVVAGIFTRRFLETLFWLLTPLIVLIQVILLIFVYIATFFVWILITIGAWLLSRFGPLEPTLARATPVPFATPERQPVATVQPVATPEALRYLIAAVLLGTLVWALTRFLWRRRPRPTSPAGETRESVFSWQLLGESAADLLHRLRGRQRQPTDPLAHLRGDPRWRYTIFIRETYSALLRRGSAADLPRAPGQTPDEYGRTLAVRFNATRAALATLTGVYDRARYRDLPATPADADTARTAWEAFQRTEPSAPTSRPPRGRETRG